MRDLLRASSSLMALGFAVGCNALFGVEEPVIVSPRVEGGAAGAGGAVAKGDGGGSDTESASSAGAGGSDGPSEPGRGGAGGDPGVPSAGRDGGSAGVAEPTASGGQSQIAGGATGTGGIPGAGGEIAASGGSSDAAGSAGAAGAPSCAEGNARCLNANELEICDDGAVVKEVCPHGCVNDECAECEVGTVECGQGNKTARVCEEDRQFGPVTTCVNQTCNPETGCAGECAPDQVRCNLENGDAQKCTAGEWTLLDECISQTERCVIEGGTSKCIDNSAYALGPEQRLIGGSLSSQTPNFLRLYPLPAIADTAVLAEMGLIGDGMPAFAQMVLYEDNGSGYPGVRVAWTTQFDVEAPGPTTSQASPLQVLLDPEKDYWVGVVFASEGSPQLYCRTNMDAPSGYERSLSFGTAFPDPFPAGALPVFDRECNLFLKVRTLTP